MIPIKDQGYEIIKKEFFNGRWYVILNKLLFHKSRLPQANFVWLLANPSFAQIPKGYAVHHLDLDPTNDDISNLALMHKFHHTAYHLKYLNRIVPVEFSMFGNKKNFPIPNGRISEPRIYPEEKGFRVVWFEDGDNGKRVAKTIRGLNGEKFKNLEEAEEAKKMLLELSDKA